MQAERDALTTLCGIVSHPAFAHIDAEELAAIQELIEAARRGEEIAVPLCRFMALIGLDVGAMVFRGSDAARLGDVRAHGTAERYTCPTTRCDRQWLRIPGERIPRCALATGPLRLCGDP